MGRRRHRDRASKEGQCTKHFYGLSAPPFSITPDPRFLFFSRRHREAYEHLLFGITERKGFIQITGEVGAGKTTICRAVLEQLAHRLRHRPDPQPGDDRHPAAARRSCTSSGLPTAATTASACSQRLNAFLLAAAQAGTDVVLFIDEAQDLSDELLEEVRLLSNLETDDRKLLQIVLDRPAGAARPSRPAASCGSCGSASPSATTSAARPPRDRGATSRHRLRGRRLQRPPDVLAGRRLARSIATRAGCRAWSTRSATPPCSPATSRAATTSASPRSGARCAN